MPTLNPGLTDAFAEEGYWWLPNAESDQVAGTLEVSPDTGATLSLFGALGCPQDLLNEPDDNQIAIHGFTKGGRPVSLLRAFRKSSRLHFPGLATQTYVANLVAIGHHFTSENTEALFDQSWFRFEEIEQWLGHKPYELIRDPDMRSVDLAVRSAPTEILADFNGTTVKSSSSLYTHTPAATQYQFHVLGYLGIGTDLPRSVNWHMQAATRLQELAALCTGHYLPLLSFGLRLAPGCETTQSSRPTEVEIYARMQRTERGSRDQGDLPLLSAKELIAFQPDAIARWFEEYETLEEAISLFFVVAGSRLPFTNIRFLLAIQALEVFHRRTSEGQIMEHENFMALKNTLVEAIPAAASSRMREKLRTMYQFANEPSLMQRLRDVMAMIEADFGGRPGGFNDSFLRTLVDTRNYNTHFSPELAQRTLDGEGMHWASRRLILLLNILFLRRLGVEAGSIREVLDRHREFLALWDRPGRPY